MRFTPTCTKVGRFVGRTYLKFKSPDLMSIVFCRLSSEMRGFFCSDRSVQSGPPVWAICQSALSELEPGQSAEIVRLAEHDGDLLHWFYDEGLVPGTRVELREGSGEGLRIAVAGAERAIDARAASSLYVRPAA